MISFYDLKNVSKIKFGDIGIDTGIYSIEKLCDTV